MLVGVKTCSIFGWTGGGEACSLPEGVVAAIIARRVALGETLTLGSDGGGAPVRILPKGIALESTVRHMRLHLFAVTCSRARTRLLL